MHCRKELTTWFIFDKRQFSVFFRRTWLTISQRKNWPSGNKLCRFTDLDIFVTANSMMFFDGPQAGTCTKK